MRCYNPQLAKTHRNYTVGEVATLFMAHKNTVRKWIKDGLPTCDGNRPTLILGSHLREWLFQQRKKSKRSCPAGSFYCVGCKKPQKPADNYVAYKPITSTRGRLVGICPSCNCTMNRITNLSNLEQFSDYFEITILQVD